MYIIDKPANEFAILFNIYLKVSLKKEINIYDYMLS
jgi:hypothetical protein